LTSLLPEEQSSVQEMKGGWADFSSARGANLISAAVAQFGVGSAEFDFAIISKKFLLKRQSSRICFI
jgi:hypothetical protein